MNSKFWLYMQVLFYFLRLELVSFVVSLQRNLLKSYFAFITSKLTSITAPKPTTPSTALSWKMLIQCDFNVKVHAEAEWPRRWIHFVITSRIFLCDVFKPWKSLGSSAWLLQHWHWPKLEPEGIRCDHSLFLCIIIRSLRQALRLECTHGSEIPRAAPFFQLF